MLAHILGDIEPTVDWIEEQTAQKVNWTEEREQAVQEANKFGIVSTDLLYAILDLDTVQLHNNHCHSLLVAMRR